MYVTDALKAIAENTSKFAKEGQVMTKRFADLISESEDVGDNSNNEEKARDIIIKMKSKLGSLSDAGKEDA